MMVNPDWHDRVCSDPELHHDGPCVRSTRICVSVIVASLANLSLGELLEQYPQLTRDDVRAALLFAAGASHNTLVAQERCLCESSSMKNCRLWSPNR